MVLCIHRTLLQETRHEQLNNARVEWLLLPRTSAMKMPWNLADSSSFASSIQWSTSLNRCDSSSGCRHNPGDWCPLPATLSNVVDWGEGRLTHFNEGIQDQRLARLVTSRLLSSRHDCCDPVCDMEFGQATMSATILHKSMPSKCTSNTPVMEGPYSICMR